MRLTRASRARNGPVAFATKSSLNTIKTAAEGVTAPPDCRGFPTTTTALTQPFLGRALRCENIVDGYAAVANGATDRQKMDVLSCLMPRTQSPSDTAPDLPTLPIA
jgi:hypothetical protein